MSNTTSPQFHTIESASRTSGVPEPDLRGAIASGRLPARVVNKTILVSSSDLAAFVASLPILQPARTADEELAHRNMISAALRSHGRAVVARVMPPLRPKGTSK